MWPAGDYIGSAANATHGHEPAYLGRNHRLDAERSRPPAARGSWPTARVCWLACMSLRPDTVTVFVRERMYRDDASVRVVLNARRCNVSRRKNYEQANR
jgi:hypothetical protein